MIWNSQESRKNYVKLYIYIYNYNFTIQIYNIYGSFLLSLTLVICMHSTHILVQAMMPFSGWLTVSTTWSLPKLILDVWSHSIHPRLYGISFLLFRIKMRLCYTLTLGVFAFPPRIVPPPPKISNSQPLPSSTGLFSYLLFILKLFPSMGPLYILLTLNMLAQLSPSCPLDLSRTFSTSFGRSGFYCLLSMCMPCVYTWIYVHMSADAQEGQEGCRILSLITGHCEPPN